jgi:hypothetical protein
MTAVGRGMLTARRKNCNLDWKFSAWHTGATANCDPWMKKMLCVYPQNKTSFSLFLEIYNF